ncbi:MAG: uroporphyrinogen-III synthase [Myxococcota bacterium]|nr:uroporphyrinogen-III synthase [Myxococcota bacterium]
MDEMLQRRGVEPVHVPLLSLQPTGERPPSGAPALALISSAMTPTVVPDLAQYLCGVPVVAVGAKTAVALRRIGVVVAAEGSHGGAAAVAAVTEQHDGRGEVWVIGARQLSPQLSAALSRAPWSAVRWSVYENHAPAAAADALSAVLPVDVITFASGSAARAFARSAQPGAARVVVIGPSTAADARSAGLPVHTIAARPSLEALVEAALQRQ